MRDLFKVQDNIIFKMIFNNIIKISIKSNCNSSSCF